MTALSELRLVRVGSTNRPKLEGVRAALAAFCRDIVIEAVDVESGVPEQPLGFEEIVAGARNRAEGARRAGACDLGVGYEDGLIAIPGLSEGWFNIGCAALSDGAQVSLGLSSGFSYPSVCSERAVAERRPIGALFDQLWSRHAQSVEVSAPISIGNVGKLTGGALPRSEYTRHAVLCALTRFIHPALYAARGGID